jgi:hypothetical protein
MTLSMSSSFGTPGKIILVPGATTGDAVEHWPDGDPGAFADLMTGFALEEHLLAQRGILGTCRVHRPRQHDGGENVNSDICHWPIRD